jgi:hypothetical protein
MRCWLRRAGSSAVSGTFRRGWWSTFCWRGACSPSWAMCRSGTGSWPGWTGCRRRPDRFNQLTGNPRAPMSKRRISDFETWPDGGVRPTMTTLKILAGVFGTTWDQLVDTADLAHMPETDRLEYLEVSRAPARPAPVEAAHPPRRRRSPREDLIAEVADESAEFGEWAGMSEVADATIEQYSSQVRRPVPCL